MGKLICSGIMSLDGYIADEEGDFSWAAPDEEVHTFINELERPVGTYLYGRRMYEVMRYWDTADEFRIFLSPVFVGGGTRFLPDGVNVRLERLEERPFDNGFVFLRYRIREAA